MQIEGATHTHTHTHTHTLTHTPIHLGLTCNAGLDMVKEPEDTPVTELLATTGVDTDGDVMKEEVTE